MNRTADGFGIQLFGLDIRIETGSPAILDALDRYLFPWLPRLPLVSGEAVSRLTLTFRMEYQAGEVRIVRDDDTEITARSVETAVPLLQSAIDEAIVKQSFNLAFVHAGVVALGDVGIVLPGLSHAGKSTLVAELVRRGATYFSDEYAVVEANGPIQPYPRALMLRNGEPEQRAVLPSQLAAKVGTRGVPGRLILMLQYTPGERFRVRRMNDSEALMILLQSTPQVLAEAPHIFGPLGRLAGNAQTFTGVRGEAETAAELILAMAAKLA